MLELSLRIPPLCPTMMMTSGWTLHPCVAMAVMRGSTVMFALDGYLWKFLMVVCKSNEL